LEGPFQANILVQGVTIKIHSGIFFKDLEEHFKELVELRAIRSLDFLAR